MNRAQQLVRKLVEAGPDDFSPKDEVLRLPDHVPEIFLADPNEKETDESWHYDLALQLNRLSGLVERLKRSGKNEDARDLEFLINRTAEFENIHRVDGRHDVEW